MDEADVKEMLDRLADIEAHLDQMQIQKLTLLNEVTVPEDVQSLVASGMKAMADTEAMFASELQMYKDEAEKEIELINEAEGIVLSEIVIPPEVQAILAEIDAKRKTAKMDADNQRTKIMIEHQNKETEIDNRIAVMKNKIQMSTQEQTKAVFDAVEARKNDIEAEFGDQVKQAQALIDQLNAEIKMGVKELKFTVIGEHTDGHGKRRQAVFTKGRKSWIQQRLDAYSDVHPEIKDCYTVGDPSVAIKAV